MFISIKGLIYLDCMFLLVGLGSGFLTGVVFNRFVPSNKRAFLIDLGVAAVTSMIAIVACGWLSQRTKWSFNQLMTNELWACLISSLALVLLWRCMSYVVHKDFLNR